MPIEINKKICDRCGCCVAVCAANCITVYENQIEIDNKLCIKCKKCVWICPVDALDFSADTNT